MIKLTDAHWVAADQIAEVKINELAYNIEVRMKGGEKHVLGADYRASIYDTASRVLALIEAEIKGGQRGHVQD